MLNHAEKAEFSMAISSILFVLCGVLVLNQMDAPAIHAFLPKHLPLWALGLTSGLMIISVANSIRHCLRNWSNDLQTTK